MRCSTPCALPAWLGYSCCGLLRPPDSIVCFDAHCLCLQSDFGGHDNVHHDQLFAYVGRGFGIVPQLPGHVDQFYNNKIIMTVRVDGEG